MRSTLHGYGADPLQVAEVVAQVLLQAQTDVLVEVAADPSSSPQGVESAVAEVTPPCIPVIAAACGVKHALPPLLLLAFHVHVEKRLLLS